MISENVGNGMQVQTLINELYFDKLCLGGSVGIRGKEFIVQKFHTHFNCLI